jgi:hypothetical protein
VGYYFGLPELVDDLVALRLRQRFQQLLDKFLQLRVQIERELYHLRHRRRLHGHHRRRHQQLQEYQFEKFHLLFQMSRDFQMYGTYIHFLVLFHLQYFHQMQKKAQ